MYSWVKLAESQKPISQGALLIFQLASTGDILGRIQVLFILVFVGYRRVVIARLDNDVKVMLCFGMLIVHIILYISNI